MNAPPLTGRERELRWLVEKLRKHTEAGERLFAQRDALIRELVAERADKFGYRTRLAALSGLSRARISKILHTPDVENGETA